MDEVVPGEKYELVITVLKGGAFARYRVGDMYRCLGLTSREDETRIPRFEYIDRVPDIIDIAGFTRISRNSIENVIRLLGLGIQDWTALKEFTPDKGRPYLHLYVELTPEAAVHSAVSKEILKDHLTIYFKYVDQDYNDLKRILGMDPLQITVLKCGTFEYYRRYRGKTLRRINPDIHDVKEMVRMQEEMYDQRRGQR